MLSKDNDGFYGGIAKIKILNLFAGIGGNRTLWGDDHEITAVENNQQIAMIYYKRFPKDKVIIGDAYEYCLWNYDKFNFIWASPPCPTHSICNYFLHTQGVRRYPDMKLWGLIIFLKTWSEQKNIMWLVENVRTFYIPLIKTSFEIGRHYFWSNISLIPKKFNLGKVTILNAKKQTRRDNWEYLNQLRSFLGIDNLNLDFYNSRKLLRNCIHPKIGKYILDSIKTKTLMDYLEV